MPRFAFIVVLALLSIAAPAAQAATTSANTRPAVTSAQPRPVLAAFRSRLGFGGLRSRSYGYSLYRRRPSLLHRAVKTAIWLYVLHLFFTHGGLSLLLWIVIIGFVFSLMRRRRRRYDYQPQSFWR